MVERNQSREALVMIARDAAKAVAHKPGSKKVKFERMMRVAFRAIIVADPQAGTATHQNGAAYSHGVHELAREGVKRALAPANRIVWNVNDGVEHVDLALFFNEQDAIEHVRTLHGGTRFQVERSMSVGGRVAC